MPIHGTPWPQPLPPSVVLRRAACRPDMLLGLQAPAANAGVRSQAGGARSAAPEQAPPAPRRGRSRPGPSPAGGTSAASGLGDNATAPAWAVAWAACGGTPLASAGTPRLPLGSCGGCSGPRPNRRRNAAAAAGPATGFAPRITFRGCQLRFIQECVWPSGHDIHRTNLWRASCSA